MKIKIKCGAKVIEVKGKKGALVAEVIQAAGFFVEHPCAGRGICGKCRVKAEGKLSRLSPSERKLLAEKYLQAGIRLSCQARVRGDAEITLPSEAVVTDKIFTGAYAVSKLKGPFGIAVDLGTTTVAAFLVTLKDGIIHKGHAVLNQQAIYGAEVISRMESAAAGKSRELKRLAVASIEEAVTGLGFLEKQLCEIERAVVVGNSAMHHLLLGLPVDSLSRLPFQPSEKNERMFNSRWFGNELEIWMPRLIGGFVGSDALACLLYLGFGARGKALAAADLGTNGEVMVTDGKRILVASTAAGPAFEGVNIECGMRAGAGAVTAAARDKHGDLEFKVIGGGEPKGIAGSGLLSLVNLLRSESKLDPSGRLTPDKIFLTNKVFLAQADIREVQKAKAAIRAAFETLLGKLKLKAGDLDELVLTGSFGARIEVKDALELGIAPAMRPERVKAFANAAGMGCGMMLEPEAFVFARELAQRAEHIELYADREFMDKFIEHMRF